VVRLVGRAVIAALILVALLAPFPALAALDDALPGLEDDDGYPEAAAFGVPGLVAALPVSGPRLHAPVGFAPIFSAVACRTFDPAFGDEPSPRSPPRV
jgi:hypothetical protein